MYKILDLFAGAGGLSLGFEETGLFSVSAIVENNENAAKTYMKNHEGLIWYKDILELDFDKVKNEIGNIDVIIGGPPCQGFSNANRQRRHLINGSNELVKRYVKAIEDIRPNVFLMENVKTITSDKHSFCLTRKDRYHIEKELQLQIHDKDILIYEGENTEKVLRLCEEYNDDIRSLILMSEEQLYIIYNICKKKDKLKKYFEKEANVKKVNEIIELLKYNPQLPSWYNEYTSKAKEALEKVVTVKNNIDESLMELLREFWNIHRLYQGIFELKSKEAIFDIASDRHGINIRMKTYVVIDYIRKSFENLGYTTNEKILNAAAFGVPQTRERFLMIGVKNEYRKLQTEEINLPAPIIENPEDYITVNEAIGDLQKYIPSIGSMDKDTEIVQKNPIDSYFKKLVMNDENKYIYNHVCTATREEALERFKQIGQGENFHSLPNELKASYENPNRTQNTVYRRLDPNKPSETVVNVRKSMWIHPVLDRAVSAREAARLQSFPDSYKFYGTKDAVYQQIGNAVPPVLGRAVAEKVLDILGNNKEYETLESIYKNGNKM